MLGSAQTESTCIYMYIIITLFCFSSTQTVSTCIYHSPSSYALLNRGSFMAGGPDSFTADSSTNLHGQEIIQWCLHLWRNVVMESEREGAMCTCSCEVCVLPEAMEWLHRDILNGCGSQGIWVHTGLAVCSIGLSLSLRAMDRLSLEQWTDSHSHSGSLYSVGW